MADNSHLLKSFDASLEGLLESFGRMGALTAEICKVATKAYLTGDDALALDAVNRDLDIDEAFEQLRADCFDILFFSPLQRICALS